MSLLRAVSFFTKRRFPPPVTTEALLKYLCVFCQRILDLDRPHQLGCGDRACYTCLEVLTPDFKQRGISVRECPGCQEPLQPFEFFPDRVVARELKGIHVICPNACQWDGLYEKYEHHLQRCPLKHLEGAGANKELEFDSKQATTDPRFAGSELLTGCKWPLFDRRALTRGELVLGLKMLVPPEMKMGTNECILPSIRPRPPQMKVIDDVYRQPCEIDTVNSILPVHKTKYRPMEEATSKVQVATTRLVGRGLKSVSLNVGRVPSSMPPKADLSHIETAITHIEERITKPTSDFANLMADFQKLRMDTQTNYRSTEEATSKVQVATKELQDDYSELALSMQTMQASSYGSVYIWKIPEFTRRRRDAVLGKTISLYSAPFYTYSELALSMQTMQASSYGSVYIWKIPEFTRRRRDATLGKTISLYSAPFYTSRHGYKLCMRVYLNGDGAGRGTHISLFVYLMKGDFDPLLPWPFRQTITLVLLSQDPHVKDIKQSFKPDGESNSFRRPVSEMNVASGCPQFCPLDLLNDHAYVWDDTLYLKASVNTRGIEHLT